MPRTPCRTRHVTGVACLRTGTAWAARPRMPVTSDLRQEPGAGKPHAGICAGGGEQSPSLPRPCYFAVAVAPSSFGLGPGLRAWRRRRVLVSSAARNASKPTGRPTLSPLRETRCRPFVLVGFQEVGEAGKALAGGGEVGKAVLGEARKGARARPRPVFGPLDQTGAHGIEVHVAVGGGEMVLVHRHGRRIVPARNGRFAAAAR